MGELFGEPPTSAGASEYPAAEDGFFALQAGVEALERESDLLRLCRAIYASAILATAAPSQSLLEAAAANSIRVIFAPSAEERAALGYDPTEPGFPVARQATFNSATRESWARRANEHVQDVWAEGRRVCLSDAEWLFDNSHEPLHWHIAGCYRRVFPICETVTARSWEPDLTIPVGSRLQECRLSDLAIRWELFEQHRVLARGAGRGLDDPPSVVIRLQGATHPDQFRRGEARLRLMFELSPPRPAEGRATSAGDTIPVRRRSPRIDPETQGETLQIGGAGRELSRLEVGLTIQPPLECQLIAASPVNRLMEGVPVQARIRNHTEQPVEVEIRFTLQTSRGRAAWLGTERVRIAGHGEACLVMRAPGNQLETGMNTLVAGMQTSFGVTLSACLLYAAPGSGRYLYLHNQRNDAASFWMDPEQIGAPFRVDLEGREERVLPLPLGRDPLAAGGPLPGAFLPVSEDGRVGPAWICPLPFDAAEPVQVEWERDALWDTYPRDHPDARRGSGTAPAFIAAARRVRIWQPAGPCLVFVAGARPLDTVVDPEQIRAALPGGGEWREPGHDWPPACAIFPGPKDLPLESCWLEAPEWVTVRIIDID